MVSALNIAFAMDESYNYTNNSHIQLASNIFGNNLFLKQTMQALILRENILASGMEVSDILKADTINNQRARRWLLDW